MKKEDLIEIKKLTVINIVDNETDALSSPCGCMKPIPNISRRESASASASASAGKGIGKEGIEIEDKRPCTYTQELNTVISATDTFDFNYMCHAAHGLSLLLIAEYDVVVQDDDDEKEEKIIDNCEGGNNVRSRTSSRRVITKTSHLLFDGGPDPKIWRENVKKLNIDLSCIDRAVLSHYHVDHSNGLRAAAEDITKARRNRSATTIHQDDADATIQRKEDCPFVVDLHKSKIVTRGLKIRGKIYPMIPNNPSAEEIESLGAQIELNDKEHVVGNGCFYVSGKIPRKTSFEKGIPGHFNQLADGKNWVPDEDIMDERYVAVKIRGRGIVVFSACSHAGIVNVCNDVVEKLDSKLVGVVGGFHLAGSSVEDRIDATIDGLKKLDPEILLAGHCTGWRGKAKLYQAFENNYQPLSVGGRYVFGSMFT